MCETFFCLVVIDSISESGSSKFGGDDDGDFCSDSVNSTASNQDKEAQTSSIVSRLFVNNDGSLAKAWKAASSFCELLLHNLIGQKKHHFDETHFCLECTKIDSNRKFFSGKFFFSFQLALTLGTIWRKNMTLTLTKNLNEWILTISLTIKRV